MIGTVLLQKDDSVAHVMRSSPDKLNAMSQAMWHELRLVFKSIQQDAQLRCVLIQGQGGHFCAGGDISEYADFCFSESSLRDFHVMAERALDAEVNLCIDRICSLAPAAARLNKQSFRALAPVLPTHIAPDLIANAYSYANAAEHREGVTAFIEKRRPRFAS